jgi:hypothetical protein
MCAVFGLACLLCAQHHQAAAATIGGNQESGQSVSIGGALPDGRSVYGNGKLPDGEAPDNDPKQLRAPANGNSVTVSKGGAMSGPDLAGASSHADSGDASASGNAVRVAGGSVNADNLLGARARSLSGGAVVTGNTVNITDGEVRARRISGAYASSGGKGAATAEGNGVSVSSGTFDSTVIRGGHARSEGGAATASNNTVNLSSGTFDSTVIRGGHAFSRNGTATSEGNSVTVSGGSFGNGYGYADIYGGYASSVSGAATAANNAVTISGGSFDSSDIAAIGGDASSVSGAATAANNAVTISGGSFDSSDIAAFGGYAWSDSGAASAANNAVTISGGSFDSSDIAAFGGFARSYSGAASASASNNAVTISGGGLSNPRETNRYFIVNAKGGAAYSSDGAATASHNTVSISSIGYSQVTATGGYASSTSGAAAASNNAVSVSSGDFRSFTATGGSASSTSGVAEASNNAVSVSGGSFAGGGELKGGYAWSDSGTAVASNNRVTVSGGTFTGETSISGGSAWAPTGTATGNTVTIEGRPVFDGRISLFGGEISADGDAFSGNALRLRAHGLTVTNLEKFEQLTFFIPADSLNQPALTVTGAADLTDGAGRASTVTVAIDGAARPLRDGDTLTLIDAGGGTLIADGVSIASARQGVTLTYAMTAVGDASSLRATASGGPQVNEQAKALSEGYLAGLALAMQGADAVASRAVPAAAAAARQGAGGVFGGASGGWSRYKTGSHLDVAGVSLLAGLSAGADLGAGRLTLGAFFEYGAGAYDTYNSFNSSASVRGDGDMRHIGGGVLGRMDFAESGPGHFYAEASGRAGSLHNDYSSSDLRDAFGNTAEYDSSTAYYGAHAGTGYVFGIAEGASLDLYGKYFWTRVASDSLRLSTGDPVDFANADSHRLRLGGRFAYDFNGYVSSWLGGAYEHEFDGRVRARTHGLSFDAPSLRGSTGIGELGFGFKPSPDAPLFFDLGVAGYSGKREGVTGSLGMRYFF